MVRVMIVDDDRTTVKLLQTLLELDGFDVVAVPRGADVLPRIEESKPDIVLMDYHLSDIHGVEVLRDLRKRAAYAQMPIIITSGMDVEDEALKAGATTFLLKPFEPDDLPALFNRLIAN